MSIVCDKPVALEEAGKCRVSVFCLFVCLFLPSRAALGILVPWPGQGWNLCPALEMQNPNHWWWWFSCSVMSDLLWPHGLQHARSPCPSLSPSVCSNSCSLSRWCHPTMSSSAAPFSSCPPSFPASVFSNELTLWIRRPSYWSFGFSPSNEYLRLMSFRMDWFDLLAVQGTLKSLFQHHSLKASILWCSAFFMIQLSLSYMAIGKTIALTLGTLAAGPPGNSQFLLVLLSESVQGRVKLRQ